MRKLSMLLVGVIALALMVPAAVPAAGFPERDITLVVPWAAGGGTDTLGRTLVKNANQQQTKLLHHKPLLSCLPIIRHVSEFCCLVYPLPRIVVTIHSYFEV